MLIQHSQGKIFLTGQELLFRQPQGIQLQAWFDDLKLHPQALMLIADAGSIRWHLQLDDQQQLELLVEQIGAQILLD